jgi:hypothetical protein
VINFTPDVTLGQIITAVIASLGLIGLLFTYKQLRIVKANSLENSRATKARFVLELNKWFNEEAAEKSFFYRLDYSLSSNGFRFDPKTFPHSDDERHLDAILYKLNHVGALLKAGVIGIHDLGWVKFIAAATFRNKEVLSYLEWLKSPGEVPDHSSFADAVFLFEQLFGIDESSLRRLRKYLD